MVRANHGHGISGVEVVERDLTVHDAIGYIAHVTTYNAWSLTRSEGLRQMDRSHIHFVGRAPKKMKRWRVCDTGVELRFLLMHTALYSTVFVFLCHRVG